MTVDGDWLPRLVQQAQRGDRVAADRLVADHNNCVRSAVYAVTGRVDVVDDIAQQVWTRVWERLGTLREPSRLRSWLYTIARNTALDVSIAGRQLAAREGSLEAAPQPATNRGVPDQTAASGEVRRMLLQAVQSLPATYREPFVLRHLEEWSYAEIADVLGLTVENVETRLVRARRMLRETLADKVKI